VEGFRNGTYKFGSEAARALGCSRVRISQILEEYAPEYLAGKKRRRSSEEQAEIDGRQKRIREETVAALNAHASRKEAAAALGITPSGLQNRIRRFWIEVPSQES